MRTTFSRLTLFLVSGITAADVLLAAAEESHPPHPDSVVRAGVPQGELIPFVFDRSKIFPGTRREVTVYVPAQYRADTPACLYVSQDGVPYNAPTIFDNLIHDGAMPVTIGVFIRPGQVPSPDAETAWDRFNRSYEYDLVGDAYVQFLIEELLPEVERRTTRDGRGIRLSTRAGDRAIGGQSSGAICAFVAAWERPEAFSRVFSAIGTYVGFRGGDRLPTLVRKFEPKPIRVFLQDGSSDNNHYAGDWWMANQMMERALTFAGYEVNHIWGEGGHNGRHAAAIFPDAMRWLWSSWPEAPKAGKSKNEHLADLLVPGAGWELVGEGYRFTEGPAANARGEVFFTDVLTHRAFKIALDESITATRADCPQNNGQAFGPDGRLYVVVMDAEKVVSYAADGSSDPKTIADGFRGNDLVVARNGNTYITQPSDRASGGRSNVWLIRPDGTKTVVDTGLRFANGITLSPDQTQLFVAEYHSRWVYAYRVEADGTLTDKQRMHQLERPETADDCETDGMCVDRDGRLYVTTNMGIQVCNQVGRVLCILPTPNRVVSNVCFGGASFDELYATCADKVYKRRLKVRGANAWEAPNKTAQPRL